MTEPTQYPGMEAPLVDRLAWANHAGVMSLFAKKALADAEAALRSTGDEHHTLDELYEYRMLYNALAANEWATHGTYPVVKSWRHSDGEECFGGGWFIVVATLPTGQVSNHYAAEHWDLFAVPQVETPPEYDGHDPAEAARRMRALLSQPTATAESMQTCGVCGRKYPAADTRATCPICWAGFGEYTADPPRIEDMAPGTTFRVHGRLHERLQPGWPYAVMDARGNQFHADPFDPSTIRDVTPPGSTTVRDDEPKWSEGSADGG